jgi:hypothetical protein
MVSTSLATGLHMPYVGLWVGVVPGGGPIRPHQRRPHDSPAGAPAPVDPARQVENMSNDNEIRTFRLDTWND